MIKTLANRLVWVIMLAMIAGLFVVFQDGLLQNAGELTVTEDGVPQNTVLMTWRGEVAPPMEALIRKAYRRWRGQKRRFVLSLHSPGGSLAHGDRVVRLLKQIAATHQLDTVVERRRTCASMCVPIFLQGENRLAADSSRWLFHEPRAYDFVTDEPIPTGARETEAMTQRFLQRYFPPAGVPDPWLADAREKMRGRDYWRSGAQLVDERSGIIMRLL
ncbi:MAG: ATP-dependent Clp protease proteolytic subunit [Pseudomonadota bacterium]